MITLVELPLVLPPTVAGIGLLAAFAGRIGLLSDILDPLKVNVVFTTTAVVLAICFVAAPFYVRQAIASFETLDKDILDAARVDGAGPLRLLLSISIPLASTGLAAGAALAFARGIGEFGATIMFAGNLRGATQTLPLLIYQDFELSFDVALAIGALLVIVSAAVLIAVKLLARLPGRARSGGRRVHRQRGPTRRLTAVSRSRALRQQPSHSWYCPASSYVFPRHGRWSDGSGRSQSARAAHTRGHWNGRGRVRACSG